jgi:hypothetical protein
MKYFSFLYCGRIESHTKIPESPLPALSIQKLCAILNEKAVL